MAGPTDVLAHQARERGVRGSRFSPTAATPVPKQPLLQEQIVADTQVVAELDLLAARLNQPDPDFEAASFITRRLWKSVKPYANSRERLTSTAPVDRFLSGRRLVGRREPRRPDDHTKIYPQLGWTEDLVLLPRWPAVSAQRRWPQHKECARSCRASTAEDAHTRRIGADRSRCRILVS